MASLSSTVKLRCIVLRGTVDKFHWIRWNKKPSNLEKLDFKNGKYSEMTNLENKFLKTGNPDHSGMEIKLKNIKEKDFGLYTCIVRSRISSVGASYRSAFVTERPSKCLKGNAIEMSYTVNLINCLSDLFIVNVTCLAQTIVYACVFHSFRANQVNQSKTRHMQKSKYNYSLDNLYETLQN